MIRSVKITVCDDRMQGRGWPRAFQLKQLARGKYRGDDPDHTFETKARTESRLESDASKSQLRQE
jgi:hypothetical protein